MKSKYLILVFGVLFFFACNQDEDHFDEMPQSDNVALEGMGEAFEAATHYNDSLTILMLCCNKRRYITLLITYDTCWLTIHLFLHRMHPFQDHRKMQYVLNKYYPVRHVQSLSHLRQTFVHLVYQNLMFEVFLFTQD